MAVAYPVIGRWFRRPNGNMFEVVAVDEDDHTIDGDILDREYQKENP